MSKLVKDNQLQTTSFVHEIILIREGILELSNRVSLSRLEIIYIYILITIRVSKMTKVT